MAGKEVQTSNLELIDAIGEEGSTQKAKIFFRLEKELIEQIFNRENDKARFILREITDMLRASTSEFTFNIVKHHVC